MARYEHLPIFCAAYDLALHLEKLVHGFARYHKHTLGADLRNASRAVLDAVVEANASADRAARLVELRGRLERLKVLVRLCHDAGGFASRRAYLHVSEQVVEIARQNEAWLRHTTGRQVRPEKQRSGAVGKGQSRESL